MLFKLQQQQVPKLALIELSDGNSITAKKTTYGTAKRKAIEAMKKTFPESACDPDCLEAQLDNYHNQCDITDKTTIKAVETGGISESNAEAAVAARSAAIRGQAGLADGEF